MIAADATQTTPGDWRYIAEGGASFVVAYIGSGHDAFKGKVLRLRKGTQQLSSLTTFPESTSSDKTVAGDVEEPGIVFQRKVTSRLVPDTFLPELGIARVDTRWLESLSAYLEPSRPASRREKDGIDLYQTKGVIETNLVSGDGLVVEIKPKWGFLPSPTHLSPETKEIKTRHCRFCIHAHYKLLQGEVVAEGFCPLDLYSGERERVERALDNLWKTWSTAEDGNIHNMRVFLDGEVVEARDPQKVKRVYDWLTANHPGVDAEHIFKEKVAERLSQSSILQILSRLQRTLDPLDIEGLATLTDRATLQFELSEVSLDDWVDFSSQYLTEASSYDHTRPDISNIRYYRLAYILSASFKDCSVIIKLNDVPHHAVTVIDLEPKSPKKLKKWEELDRTIVKAFDGVERTPCADALAGKD